jgi:hypothetical protein
VVLAKALFFPCIAEIIQAQNEFPIQEHWSPDTQGHHNEAEGCISLGGGASMHLSQVNHQIVKNLHRPPGSYADTENYLGKEKFTSVNGYASIWAQQVQGAGNRSLFLFPMQWALPLYLDWSSSGTQSACDWLMLHLEFGGGVGSNSGQKTELSEQEPATASN